MGDIQLPEVFTTDNIDEGSFAPSPVNPKIIPINIDTSMGLINDFNRLLSGIFALSTLSSEMSKDGTPQRYISTQSGKQNTVYSKKISGNTAEITALPIYAKLENAKP